MFQDLPPLPPELVEDVNDDNPNNPIEISKSIFKINNFLRILGKSYGEIGEIRQILIGNPANEVIRSMLTNKVDQIEKLCSKIERRIDELIQDIQGYKIYI